MANNLGCNRLEHHEQEYSAPTLSGIEWRFLDRSLEKSYKNYNRISCGSVKTYLGDVGNKTFHYKLKNIMSLYCKVTWWQKNVDLTRPVLMELKQVLRD